MRTPVAPPSAAPEDLQDSLPSTATTQVSPSVPSSDGLSGQLNASAREVERMAALRSYEILDTPSEDVFDDFTRMAAAICDKPISTVTLIDEDRQWFKARLGIATTETPRNVAFCNHAIQQPDEVFEVEDTQQDERFHDFAPVTGYPHVRSYAGASLVTPDGQAVGTLCVIDDQKPGALTPEQRDALQALARQVVAQLELRRANLRLEREVQAHNQAREKLQRSEERFQKFKEREDRRAAERRGKHPNALTTAAEESERPSFNPLRRLVNLSFERGLATWLGLLAAMLLLIGVICATSVSSVIAASEQQQRSLAAQSSINELLSSIKDAETGQRGYLLTDETEYLTPYNEALRLLNVEVGNVERTLSSETATRAHFQRLTQLTRERLGLLGETIRLHREGNPEAAMRLVKTGRGEHLMGQIRQEGRALLRTQTALQARHSADEVEALRRLSVSFFLSIGLALCMLGTIYQRTQRELNLRRRLEDEAFDAQERFRQLSAGSFEGVCISRNGIIVDASDKFGQMFGYASGEVTQRSIMEFLVPLERERVSDFVRLNESTIYETIGLRRDGSQFPLEVCGRGEYQDGVLTRVTSLRDITERKQIEVALQDVNGEFARLNKELSRANDELELRVSRRTEQLREANDDLAGANTRLQDANARQGALTKSLRTVLNVADELLICPTLDTLLRRAVEAGRERLGLERCAIYLLREGQLHGTYGTSLRGQTVDESANTCSTSGFWGDNIKALDNTTQRWHVAHDIPVGYIEDGQLKYTEQRGWLVATPIVSAQGVVGIFFNDAALSSSAFDSNLQDVVGVYCSVLGNLLERNRTEDALQRSEERYRSLVQSTAQIVWSTTPEGMAHDLPMWRDFTGQTLEETRGYGWLDAIHPDDQAHTQADWTRAVTSHTQYKTEYRIRRRDGVYRLFVARGTPVLEPDGTLREWVGTCTDIEDAHQAEVALQEVHDQLRQANDELEERVRHRTAELAQTNSALLESETRLRAVVANAPTVLFEVDRDGIIRLEEGRGVDSLGHKPSEVVGRSIYEVYRDAPHFTANVTQALQGEATNAQVQIGPHSFETAYTPLYDAQGRVMSVTGVATDVSARVEAERIQQRFTRELQEANTELERSNAELAQFAYVASHDLQEPLRMVSSYTQMLARRYKGKLDEDADEFIGFAVDGVHRMQRLIKDLLAYSRVGSQGRELAPVAMEAVFERALLNLRIALEESEAVVTCDPMPTVDGDSGQLGQLLQNLLGNALKFRVPDVAPRIHFSAKRRDFDPALLAYEPARNGHSARESTCSEWLFCVRDNGIGMEEQHKERIFAIFQRLHAREEYEGTGIGLAICKKIVERHGGRIWVESQPGQGAAFYWTMPLQEVDQEEFTSSHKVCNATP